MNFLRPYQNRKSISNDNSKVDENTLKTKNIVNDIDAQDDDDEIVVMSITAKKLIFKKNLVKNKIRNKIIKDVFIFSF